MYNESSSTLGNIFDSDVSKISNNSDNLSSIISSNDDIVASEEFSENTTTRRIQYMD
jgi:hypothetical protein